MKKFAALFSLVTLALFLPITIFAGTSKDFSERVVVNANEVIEDDFFAAGEIIEIHGIVDGDVYAFGGEIFVDGEITGDLIGAAGTINVTGKVGQNMRMAAGEIDFSGEVGKNITVATGMFNMRGIVNENVYVAAGTFNVSQTASIGGNLNYTSDPDERISPSASVSGTITRHEPDSAGMPTEKDIRGFFRGLDMAAMLVSIITSLIIGLILIRLMPKYVGRASELITTSFLKSLVIGIASLVLIPILLVVIFSTIVGIPLSIFFLALFMVYMFIARIYVMVALGRKLEDWTGVSLKGNYYHFLLGLVVYYLLSIIPIIGGIIKFFVMIAGFGAALRNERNTYFIAKGKKII